MNNRYLLVIFVVLALGLTGYLLYTQIKSPAPPQIGQVTGQEAKTEEPVIATSTSPQTTTTPETTTPTATTGIVSPIADPESRNTKKFFGTYVTPKNSPVSPERFTGYHTGLDFETTPAEQDNDVAINVICTGKLLRKTTASGYGGYAVQACTINNQAVTVVYGHLRLTSIIPKVGDELTAGTALGVLGTGYSTETDGERKHLHLSIHVGSGIDIKGYVQTKSALSSWMDPKTVLGL